MRARIIAETVAEKFPLYTKTSAEWGGGGGVPGIGGVGLGGMSHNTTLCDIKPAILAVLVAVLIVYRAYCVSHNTRGVLLRCPWATPPLCLGNSAGNIHTPCAENFQHFVKN